MDTARTHAQHGPAQVAVLVTMCIPRRPHTYRTQRDKCATHGSTKVPSRARPGRVGRHTVGEGGRAWWRGFSQAKGGMSK